MSNRGDAFFDKAQDKINAMSREIALLAAEEEAVRGRRSELEALRGEWQNALKLYGEAMADATDGAPGQLSAVLDAPKESIGNLTFRFLSEHGMQAKIVEIVRWLIAIGKLPADPEKAGANYSAVYTAMLRNEERFEKVGRGEFRLRPDDRPVEPHGSNGQSPTAAPMPARLLAPSRV